ncbi:GGDEF domain-containing protein [Pseudomonas sp. 32.2.56]|uniref:GGDEF domain-containing protein n=1 Tax=Pseudomonas sp. 32.2.56 TaxID=2969303 RepID=UPI00214FE8F2|nr:GGDEF domain-containing protein [Pseudomonas sp. 32.2.56]MCR4511012.1 GGDEF domain-containing protein [Pseudomonas sp. 32.2.56]
MPSQAESAVANQHIVAVERLPVGFALRRFAPELEVEYRDFAYRSYQQTRRVAICLLLISFLAFFTFDLLLLYSVGANPITLPVMLVRLCALLIIAFGAYRVLTYPDVATGYRWIPIGLGCLSLGMLLVTLMYHQALEQMQLPYGLEGMMLIQIVIFVPIGYSYRNSLCLGIATLVCTGLALQLTSSSDSSIQYLTSLAYLTVATLAAATAGYCQEHSMRVLFLTKRDLRSMADTDGLTQLYNRRSFDLLLQRALREAQREQTRIALVMLDLDHFKAYNDCYGHPAGDLALQRIAGVLASYPRRDLDFAARLGGEEFALVLRNPDSAYLASTCESIRRKICEELAIEHLKNPAQVMTASLGASFSKPSDTTASLYQRADLALYRAKASGRNRVEID